MDVRLSRAQDVTVSSWLHRIQRCWLGALFSFGLAYIALVPPFKAIDEVAHWDRTWSVARGQYSCMMIPTAAAQFVDRSFRFEPGPAPEPFPWSHLSTLYEFTGDAGLFWVATNGCHYPPLGYLPGALAIRMFTPGELSEPRAHKPFLAHYGIRLANWIFFFACAVYAFRFRASRTPALILLSVPLVVHQAMSINNDAVVWGGALVVIALLAQPANRWRIYGAIAIIALLSAIKPIHAIGATCVWVALWDAHRDGKLRKAELLVAALLALALPIALWVAWNFTHSVPILGTTTGMPVANVDEAAQFAILKAEPLRVFTLMRLQLEELFTRGPIDGGWRGFLLALGWYQWVAPDHVYVFAIAALVLGFLALRGDTAAPRRPIPLLLRLAIYGSVIAYAVVVVLILYAAFTPVGALIVFGVQGRYFLYPFILLTFVWSLHPAKHLRIGRRATQAITYLSLTAGLLAHLTALVFIRNIYWQH